MGILSFSKLTTISLTALIWSALACVNMSCRLFRLASFRTLSKKGRCRRNRFIVCYCSDGGEHGLLLSRRCGLKGYLAKESFQISILDILLWLFVQKLELSCQGTHPQCSYQVVNVTTSLSSFAPLLLSPSGNLHCYEWCRFRWSLLSSLSFSTSGGLQGFFGTVTCSPGGSSQGDGFPSGYQRR